ncbi:MAG: phospholipid/cholesterol/gamma-HCH transport system substrate-binding protein [Mycobacterium sp.]|jgi:hypothetical protein|nr:phospholipid/cholesterol/gamma-HCH transport system substrate-binding protein [Mycobacterium sp.]
MPPGAPGPPPPDGAPLPAEPPAPPLEPPPGAGAGSDAPPAAPSAFTTEGSDPGPSVAIAHYDPQTGEYATPAGQVFRPTDLVAPSTTWRDLVYKAGQ